MLKCKTQKKQLLAAKKISQCKSFLNFVNKLPSHIKTFTNMQLKHTKKARGRRFSDDEKILALTIFKQGPKVYKILRTMFVLPSKRSLQNLLSAITFRPGINKQILNDLKENVSKMSQEKMIINLLFDEVSLAPAVHYNKKNDEIIGFEDTGGDEKTKYIADHALVFMIKGIKGKTKQPICYTLCRSSTKKEELKKLLIEIIRELRQTGLKVVCTICDQAATNVSVIRSLQEETRVSHLRKGLEYNSRAFEIDDIKVYPLFDSPHLLKGVRNNMLIKNVKFVQNGEQKCAKWDHLIQLLQVDEGDDEIRLVNKLTENHVIKNKIPKMKVKIAAQVFSQRVSAAMRFLASKYFFYMLLYRNRTESFVFPVLWHDDDIKQYKSVIKLYTTLYFLHVRCTRTNVA